MSSVSETAPAYDSTLTRPALRLIILGLMLVILLGALDQTIISVSMPRIAADLQGGSTLSWVMSGYLIAMAVATPIYGKLGDIYGRRVVLSSAILVFVVTSIMCAAANSMTVLITGRILQGLGGGGLISVAQACIADVASPRERGKYQAYVSTAYAVASVSGPMMGGLLTSYLSWRWVFWINVPLGLCALGICHHALRKVRIARTRRVVDYLGAGLLTAGLSALLVVITRIGYGVALTETGNAGLVVLTLVALGAYGFNAVRSKDPVIPLHLFRIRTFTISSWIIFISFIELISLTVLVPMQLQMVTPLGPAGAALRLIPFSFSVPLGAYLSGFAMSRWGRFKHIQLVGTAIIPLAVWGLAMVNPNDAAPMTLFLVMAGAGIGMQLPTSTVAMQNVVPHHHVGIASAISVFCRSLGAAIGVALLMAVLVLHLRTGVTTVSGVDAADLIGALVTHQADALAGLNSAILQDAAMRAFAQVYKLAAGIAVVSIALTLSLKNQLVDEMT